MGKLMVDAVNWGDVAKSDYSQDFPCMNTNYKEFSWAFEIDKEFADFAAMQSFEKTTIKSYFSNREKNVSYNGLVENNSILVSYKRKEIRGVYPTVIATYEVVFTKENA